MALSLAVSAASPARSSASGRLPAPAAHAEASRTVPADDDSTDPVTEEAGTSRQVIGVLVGLAVVAIVGATLLVGLRKSG